MNCLALNGGSATVKAAWFTRAGETWQRARKWNLSRHGDDTGLPALAAELGESPAVVVHRIVHGGDQFAAATELDEAVLQQLRRFIPLAPLHQPFNLDIVAAAQQQWPTARHIGCFDTAFHQTQTDLARRFALPRALHERGIKRYGFHGLSYASVTGHLLAQEPGLQAQRTVILHLGSGASACAIQHGKSVATSMGFSPLDGLVMSTRCGQLDPGVLLHLLREGMDTTALETLLYKQSGLLGVSGSSSDLRALLRSEDDAAQEAITLFVQRCAEQVAQLATHLQGLDAVVFTGGIGEHQAVTRARIAERLGWLGLVLDPAANSEHAWRISSTDSHVAGFVIPTDEEAQMVAEAWALLGARHSG